MENPAEVQELRNKLRMMKFPQDEILNTVRRQQRAIRKQKHANETVRVEIQEFETQIDALNQDLEAHHSNVELQHLQEKQKSLANKLSSLMADCSIEENKRKKLEEEVSRANSHSGGLFKQLRANDELQARLRTMENRLDKALVRYNHNLSTLATLRSQIDELRKDRHNFQLVQKTSQKTLENKASRIAVLIKESNDAYASRDKRKMSLAELQAAEKVDVGAFEKELNDLELSIAAQKITQNHRIDQRPTELLDSQTSQSDQQEELTILTDQYHGSNQRVLELCGAKDVHALFAEAEALERENYSLYSYVVEHGARQARLQEDIDGLEMQKETLEHQSGDRDAQQSESLQNLIAEIQKVDHDLTQLRQAKAETEQEFAALYAEIDNLFEIFGCSWEGVPDGKTTPTSANAMFCLSAIENQITNMVGALFDKTREECLVRDIKPATFLPDDRPDSQAPGASKPTPALTKQPDAVGKLVESTKPLSIEELRELFGQFE